MKLQHLVYAPLMLTLACGVPIERFEKLQKQYDQCVAGAQATQQSLEGCQGELNKQAQAASELSQKTKTYEELMGKLKSEVDQGKVKISEMEDRLTVNLIDKILFETGAYKVNAEGQAVLKKISDVLKSIQDKRIQVEGHTDNVKVSGGRAYTNNWELSVLRATSVVSLLAKEGVEVSRLSAAGFGEHAPVASNDSEDGRRQNRRIEIVLLPLRKSRDASRLGQ